MKNLGIRTEQKDVINREDLPTKLPNPQSISFTGAATGSYDGSSALSIEIPTKITSINGLAGGTLTSPLTLTGGDSATASKIILSATGQITDSGTATLFGLISDDLYVGHSNYALKLRGKGSLTFNNNAVALISDIGNGTLTIKQGGVLKGTFTANQSGNTEIDLGIAPTVTAGTTTTLSASSNATVTNSGTNTAAVFNFGIPRGTTFTPSVSSAGVISWTNDGGKTNPANVNIKGETGATGAAALNYTEPVKLNNAGQIVTNLQYFNRVPVSGDKCNFVYAPTDGGTYILSGTYFSASGSIYLFTKDYQSPNMNGANGAAGLSYRFQYPQKTGSTARNATVVPTEGMYLGKVIVQGRDYPTKLDTDGFQPDALGTGYANIVYRYAPQENSDDGAITYIVTGTIDDRTTDGVIFYVTGVSAPMQGGTGGTSTSILPSQIKGASDTQALFVGCDNQKIAFNVGNKPTYCGTDTGITWEPNGFGISQGINEGSGIWFDGDGINMWSPCDRDAITYYDEDDGSKVFRVSNTGIVYRKDGKAALYTGDKTACPNALSITYDGTTTTYDGSEAKSITITTPTLPTNYVTTDTDQNITGKKTFGSNNPVTVRLDVANYSSYGYNGFWVYQGATSGAKATRYYCGKITNRDVSGTDYTLTLPLKSGTIALTSDITGGGGGLFRHDIVISDYNQSINLIVSMYTSSAQEINNATFMDYITYFGGAYLCKGDLNGTALIYLSMYKNGTDPQKLDVEVCTQAFTGIESLTINIADSDTVFLSDTVTQC